MDYAAKLDMYRDILETVVGNGQIENFDSDLEIEAVVDYEARHERGLSDEDAAEAVEYALSHIDR